MQVVIGVFTLFDLQPQLINFLAGNFEFAFEVLNLMQLVFQFHLSFRMYSLEELYLVEYVSAHLHIRLLSQQAYFLVGRIIGGDARIATATGRHEGLLLSDTSRLLEAARVLQTAVRQGSLRTRRGVQGGLLGQLHARGYLGGRGVSAHLRRTRDCCGVHHLGGAVI